MIFWGLPTGFSLKNWVKKYFTPKRWILRPKDYDFMKYIFLVFNLTYFFLYYQQIDGKTFRFFGNMQKKVIFSSVIVLCTQKTRHHFFLPNLKKYNPLTATTDTIIFDPQSWERCQHGVPIQVHRPTTATTQHHKHNWWSQKQ